MLFKKWFYPRIKLTRWVILLVLGFLLFSLGISGFLGRALPGYEIKLAPAQFLNSITRSIRDFIIYLTKLNTVSLTAVLIGILGITLAIRRGQYSFALRLYPEKSRDLESKLSERLRLRRGPKIVAIGGGTGLPAVLKGLKEYTYNITAVVTVADDGGSSGKLVRQRHVLPPGDIRNCLVALAEAEPLMSDLFQHRFGKKGSEEDPALDGHSFGNLFIAALTDVVGGFDKAVEETGKILSIRGKVVPVSVQPVVLEAQLKDKSVVQGQTNISRSKFPIERLYLKPRVVKPTPAVLEAIKHADAIIMGPGSLYTSIIPNLLVDGVGEAIAASKASKIYICNTMTQQGETDGFSASDHANAIIRHARQGVVDYVIMNNQEIPEDVLGRYRSERAEPVKCDDDAVRKSGMRPVKARILSFSDGLVRHDSRKLAKLIMKVVSL